MTYYRSELLVVCLVALIGMSGALAWAANSALSNGIVGGGEQTAASFIFASAILSGLSLFVGVGFILPCTLHGRREHGKLRQMTETLSERSQSLEQAVATDSLTGIFNRRYFDDAMVQYIRAFGRIGKPIGLIILDLDFFKKINDTYGHDVGDDVLRNVADCLRAYTRDHDIVARLGGEEFGILTPNISDGQIQALAERVRKAVSGLKIVSGNVCLKVTLSAGVAIWDNVESRDELYRRADKRLYAAKRQGRNMVCAA